MPADWSRLYDALRTTSLDVRAAERDDIVQEAALRMLELEIEPRDWDAYARTTARNLGKRAPRDDRLADPGSMDIAFESPQHDRGEPLSHWFRRDLLPALERMLPPRQALLLAAMLEESTIRDLAERLGRDRNSVRRSIRSIAAIAQSLLQDAERAVDPNHPRGAA